MTQSSTQKIPDPQPQDSLLVVVLTLMFRLLLLGVSASVAWTLGMAIAQFYPHPNPEIPLTERLWRRQPTPTLPETTLPPSSPASTPSVQIPLTNQQQQNATLQLQQLQQQLNTLIGQTAALELKLGISRPAERIEQRLQRIEQQLSETVAPSTSPPVKTVSPSGSTSTAVQARNNDLVVTLPSDVLFGNDSSSLRPGASVILDNLVADIERYPQATIRVAGHTDNQGSVQNNLALSLQQAEAVVQYLSTAVGSSNYHWIAFGYGLGRPTIENDSPLNQQLNRRIEVVINP